ncbi:MAG: hypothetical protein V3V08_07420 [Nannocystaceae bacterium]
MKENYNQTIWAPWPVHAVFAVFAVFAGLIATHVALGESTWVRAALPIVIGAIWASFSALRLDVTRRDLRIRFGLFGPRIPIESVRDIEEARYRWTAFGGWGIRHRRGTQLYCLPGDGGTAVKIRWCDQKGRVRTTLVGTSRARELASELVARRVAGPA